MQRSPTASIEANIVRYYLFHFFLNLQLWFPIWIIYLKEERGLTQAQVTLIDVPFWLSIVLLQIPAAAIADRWGRKPTLIASASAFVIAITLFGLAATFPILLMSYLIWGLSFALLNGTESAFLYDTLKSLGREDEYPRLYGRGFAIATMAQLAGTLIGAPLADATSLSFPIVFSGGITVASVLAALSFTEPPVIERIDRPSYGQIIRDSIQIVRRQPAIRYSILLFGILSVGHLAPIFFFQPFLRDHGIHVADVGIWQTPTRIIAVFGALGAARLVLFLGERRTFYMMPVVLVAGYAMLALWDSVYAQIAFPAMNLVVIMSMPILTNYVNRRVSSEQRATVVSLTSLTRSLVLIPSAPALGLLYDHVSASAAFAAGGVIIAACSIPLLALWLPHLLRAETHEPLPAPAVGIVGGD